jgi:hypothetical protein
MENFFLIVAFLIVISLVIPWLIKFKIWQFFGLILGGFINGYLLNEVINLHPERPWYGYGLFFLLIGGLIYQSLKFYQTIK